MRDTVRRHSQQDPRPSSVRRARRLALTTASSASFVAAILLTGSPAARAAPQRYQVDSSHTAVWFAASHFDRTTVRGRFGKIDGAIAFDPETGTGSIDFTVDTASVDTGNRSLDNVLRSAQFLDADSKPYARFTSTRFIQDGGRLVAVEGNLQLGNATHPVRLDADRFSCGTVRLFGTERDVCGGDFHTTVQRSAFGITRFLPEVGDAIRLDISVEASPMR